MVEVGRRCCGRCWGTPEAGRWREVWSEVKSGKKQPQPHACHQMVGQRHAHAHAKRPCMFARIRALTHHGYGKELLKSDGISAADATCNFNKPADTSSNS